MYTHYTRLTLALYSIYLRILLAFLSYSCPSNIFFICFFYASCRDFIFIKFGESSRQAVTLRKREEGTKKIGCMATFPNVSQQYESCLNHLS